MIKTLMLLLPLAIPGNGGPDPCWVPTGASYEVNDNLNGNARWARPAIEPGGRIGYTFTRSNNVYLRIQEPGGAWVTGDILVNWITHGTADECEIVADKVARTFTVVYSLRYGQLTVSMAAPWATFDHDGNLLGEGRLHPGITDTAWLPRISEMPKGGSVSLTTNYWAENQGSAGLDGLGDSLWSEHAFSRPSGGSQNYGDVTAIRSGYMAATWTEGNHTPMWRIGTRDGRGRGPQRLAFPWIPNPVDIHEPRITYLGNQGDGGRVVIAAHTEAGDVVWSIFTLGGHLVTSGMDRHAPNAWNVDPQVQATDDGGWLMVNEDRNGRDIVLWSYDHDGGMRQFTQYVNDVPLGAATGGVQERRATPAIAVYGPLAIVTWNGWHAGNPQHPLKQDTRARRYGWQ